MGTWETVYGIASQRHHTKQGHLPLSEKALHVVQTFVAYEKAATMADEIAERRRELLREIFE